MSRGRLTFSLFWCSSSSTFTEEDGSSQDTLNREKDSRNYKLTKV